MMLHAHEIKFKNMQIQATAEIPDIFIKLIEKYD